MKKVHIGILDDVRISRKLFLVYFLCIFLPLIITDSIFIIRVSKNIEKQKYEEVDNALRRINLNLDKTILDAIQVSHVINADKTLSDYLDKHYNNPEEYAYNYINYLAKSLIKYSQIYGQILNINIFTGNKTIPSTSNFLLIDDKVKKTDWYMDFILSKDKVMFYAYVDDGVNYFSVIRRFDNFNPNRADLRILKIDLRLDSFKMITQAENIDGSLNIVNSDGQVIFSTKNNFINSDTQEFVQLDSIPITSKEIMIQRPIEDINLLKGYSIVCILNTQYISKAMESNIVALLLISFGILVIATLIIALIAQSLTSRVKLLTGHIEKTGSKEFEVLHLREGKDEIGELIRQYNQMKIKIRELITDVYEADIQKKNLDIERKQAELNALHCQLNPHFLFNTLSAIHMRSMIKDEKETAEVVIYLSNILRRLITWDKDMVTVQEEVNFIQEYLKIQKYRFGDKIDYQINVDPEARRIKIPMMCYQVFVENACEHGIEAAISSRYVRIDVVISEGFLCGCISDNGVGMDQEVLKDIMMSLDDPHQGKNRIGIKNVYRRLLLLYGDRFRFRIESKENEGCKVFIDIAL